MERHEAMTAGGESIPVLPANRSSKAATTSAPVDVAEKEGMLESGYGVVDRLVD